MFFVFFYLFRTTFLLNDLYVYVNIGTIFPENGATSLPCQLEDDQPACLPCTERHAWGRLFELGKLDLNVCLALKKNNLFFNILYRI